MLLLASGEQVEKIDPSVRSRLKRALYQEGLAKLRPRLVHRSEPLSFRAHPGEIPYLLGDSRLVRSGVSASGDWDLDLVAGREADAYVRERNLKELVAHHALEPAEMEGNVRLRVVPEDAWPFLEGRKVAPRAAVALDLVEEFDPRSALAGRESLADLDRQWRTRRAPAGKSFA